LTIQKKIKELGDLDDKIARESVALELLSLANTAEKERMQTQRLMSAMHAESAKILEENSHLKSWVEEKANYDLYDLGSGALVYKHKPVDGQPFKPEHYLCANCFQKNQKSILQSDGHSQGDRKMSCHSCKAYVLYRVEGDNKSYVVSTQDGLDFRGY